MSEGSYFQGYDLRMKKNSFAIILGMIALLAMFEGQYRFGFEARAAELVPQVLWQSQIDRDESSFPDTSLTTSIGENTTHFVYNGSLHAVNTLTGKTSWLKKGAFQGSIRIEGNRLFTSIAENKLLALDTKSGKILWSVNTSGRVTEITILNNVVIASHGDISAHDIKTGKQLWITKTTNKPIQVIPDKFTPLFQSNGVIVCKAVFFGLVPSYMTIAIDASNGRIIWSSLGDPIFIESKLIYVAKVSNLPYVAGDLNFKLSKLNIIDGKKLSTDTVIVKEADPKLEASKLPGAQDRSSGYYFLVINKKLWVYLSGGYASTIERFSFIDLPIRSEARYEGLGRDELRLVQSGTDALVVETGSGEVFGLESAKVLFSGKYPDLKIRSVYSDNELIYFFYENNSVLVFNFKKRAKEYSIKLAGLNEFDYIKNIIEFKNITLMRFSGKLIALKMI